MIKQNADGSITVGGKTIQKLTVDSALDYYKAKTQNENPKGKAVLGFQALSQYLAPIKGGRDSFEEWALAQIEKESLGRKNALSVMETFLVQYGIPFDTVNGQSYSKNLELFFRSILAPQLCKQNDVPYPAVLEFKDVAAMGDPKFWGTKGDTHVEAYGYCSVDDLGEPLSNTTVAISKHTLTSGEVAESILRHELAHHMEWTAHNCWGNNILDPESGQMVPLAPEWTRGYNKGHSKVFIACSKSMGLTLKGATVKPVLDAAWYAGTFASPDITLTTKRGKTFTFNRAEFYRKK